MRIEYYLTQDAGKRFISDLKSLALKPDVKKICDVGGGANPILSLDFINEHGLEYTILDISAEQLAKAPDGYHKLQVDITNPNFNLDVEYDLVFSKFLAEHVSSGLLFHKNIMSILRKGGYAFHYFPTLYNLPFLMNYIMPKKLSERILLFVAPHRKKEGNHGKFPAYYSWCRGPIKSQINKFDSLGYNIEMYRGFFGHKFYNISKKIKIFKVFVVLNRWFSRLLVKHPLPWITTFAHVLLRKR